jgi:hypothetical protein
MFERDFIKVVRAGDDGEVWIRKDQIVGVCDNADASGIIEGSCTVFLMGSLAFALNHSTQELVNMIKSQEIVN